MLFSRTLRVLPFAAACLLAACATGDPADIPCAEDAECPAGMDCDLERSFCVQASISTTNNRTIPTTDPNNRNNGEENNGTTTGENNTTGINNGTTGTNNGTTTGNNNTTGTNNHPMTCTPECDAPATCENGSCVFPDCSAVGDGCDPSRPSQNGFTCLDIEGGGFCAIPCERVGTADSCGPGDYCVSYDSNPVCLPSVCDTNTDCTDGTCVLFDNDFKFCIDAGPLSPGDACDPDSQDPQCAVGEACDPLTGSCEPLCDLYAGGCGANHYCAMPVTPVTGLCTHSVVGNAPRGPFLTCDTPGAACDDASRCFAFDTQNFCLNYCRPGMNDCAGVTSGAGATVCDAYALYQPGLGLCWPPCSAGDCGAGATCVNQVCRVACTPGNEVNDCCDGNANCPAYCNPATQLCE